MVAGETITVDIDSDQAFIEGRVIVGGTKALSEVNSLFMSAGGVSGSPSSGGSASDKVDLQTGDYELVLSPGAWRNAFTSWRFQNFSSDPAEFLNESLGHNDALLSSNPTTLVAGQTVTQDLTHRFGDITITFSVVGGGLLSNPRLQGSCQQRDESNLLLYNYSFNSSTFFQQDVPQGIVNFTGQEATCTITARASVGSSFVTFGQLTVDVVPGAVIIVDIGGPTLDVQFPEPDEVIDAASIVVTGTATDDVGVASVTVNGVVAALTSTGNPADPNEVSFSATIDIVKGPNQVVTIATDTSGKTGQDTRTVFSDSGPPDLAFTPSDGTVTSATEITVEGTASNDAGVASVTVNGVSVAITPTGNSNDITQVSFSTPLSLTLGPNDITVVATDISHLTVTKTHTVTVSDNEPPVCDDLTISVNEADTVVVRLPCSDPDAGDTIEIELVALSLVSIEPIVVTGSSPDFNVTVTPSDPNFNGDGGTFTFFATDSSGAMSMEAEATITVNPVNDAPQLTQPGAVVLNEGSSTTINLDSLVSDVETADSGMTWTASSNDSDVTVSISSARVLTINGVDDASATVTLTVTDGGDPDGCSSAPCSAALSAGTTVGVTVNNVNPTANAGADQTVFRNDLVSLAGTWTDPATSNDNPYSWSWDLDGDTIADASATASYGDTINQSTSFALEGDYTLTFEVTDKDNGSGSDTVDIEVLNRPPDCTNAGPSTDTLWPPNHEMVAINVLGVTDPEGDDVTINIDSIMQDEPVDAEGSGNFSPDGKGVGTDTAHVRAERIGDKKTPGNGRVYEISFTADDGHGGSCSGTVAVGVPHDQGGSSVPINDGAIYDSTEVVPGTIDK